MRRPWFVITLAAVAGAVGGLIAIVGGFLTSWNCSSGDGGVPYVSPRSPQADVCSATGDGLLLIVLGIAAAAGIAVAAYHVGRAWIAGGRPAIPFVALVVGAVVAPIAILWVANLPSNECTGEDAAAYDAWVEAGGRGDAPVDCATY
ncbi:MAG TPA: hypothetical protein VFY99_02330 [Solirubrobacterales bacterium]